jgi:hypothetical protein
MTFKNIVKPILVLTLICLAVALLFCFIARPLLSFLPDGDRYAGYWWAVPWHIAIIGVSTLHGFYTTAEIAAGRFGFLKWILPIELAYPAVLLFVTGHGYLVGIIPESWTNFLAAHNVHTLETMLWWMTAVNGIKAILCLLKILTSRINKATQ